MCSAAWKYHEDGYELGFNRDEKWSRPLSTDPEMERDHPVPGACARDSAAGGTWLFTNQCGVTLAVMNAYPGGVIPPPGSVSRGMLPLIAANHASVDEIEHVLLFETDWKPFAPCELLLMDSKKLVHFGWDGRIFRKLPKPGSGFLTTSSVATEVVKSARLSRFEQIRSLPVSMILDDDHADDAASAIYVTRDDGGTVSQTRVVVGSDIIRFVLKRRNESPQEIVFPRQS